MFELSGLQILSKNLKYFHHEFNKKWIQLKTNNPGPPAPPPPGFNIIRPPPPPLVRFLIFVIINVSSNPIMSSQPFHPYLCQQAYFFHPICFGKHESLDGRMHSSGPRSCGSGSAQWSPLTRKNILRMLNMILRKLVSAKLNISPHRKSVKSKCAVQRNLTWWLWKSEQSPGAWNAAYGMAGYHKQAVQNMQKTQWGNLACRSNNANLCQMRP